MRVSVSVSVSVSVCMCVLFTNMKRCFLAADFVFSCCFILSAPQFVLSSRMKKLLAAVATNKPIQ